MNKSGQLVKSGSSRKNFKKSNVAVPSQESKFLTMYGGLSCDASGAILLLNGLHLGYAIDQRLGRSVLMDRIDMHLDSSVNASTGADQIQRILLVLDHQPNGAALTITDVLDSVNPISQPNLANRSRFVILHDDQFVLNASGEPYSQRVNSYHHMLNQKIVFNDGNAGDISDITTNSLYLITFSNVASGSASGSLSVGVRLSFHNLI
jgi:hypothetical protein